MGKSYAFLVLAICLSATINSCAKTEKNRTGENIVFERGTSGKDKRDAQEERYFSGGFIYQINGSTGSQAGEDGDQGMTAVVLGLFETDVSYTCRRTPGRERKVQAYRIPDEEKKQEGSFFMSWYQNMKNMIYENRDTNPATPALH